MKHSKHPARPGVRLAVAALVIAGCGQILGIQEIVPNGACSSAADCDDSNLCTTDSCGPDGACVHQAVPDGLSPNQLPGDCQVVSCAAGVAQSAADDHDVPDDGNPCTTDACDNGIPSNTNADGHGCTVDGGQGMCVAGSCVPAVCTLQNEATLCPDDNPCTDDHCNVDTGQCEHTPSADGPAVDQVTGDCQLAMCTGGALQNVNDNSDVQYDASECTDDVCNEGVPQHPPMTVGSPCAQNGGQVCDGAGACVECNQPVDCVPPPTDNECQTRTCTAHVCGYDYVPANQALANQNPGDCKSRQCDGAGNVIEVTDSADLPVDGNDCTNDLCTGNVPSNPPKATGTPCGSGQICDSSGHCGCSNAAQCGPSTQCMWWTCDSLFCNQHFQADGYAVPNGQTPNDCHSIECDGAGNEQNRIDDADSAASDGKECTVEGCSGGVPQHTPKAINTGCTQGGAGRFCDDNGDCVQCNGDAQCPDQHVSCKVPACSSQACGTINASDGTAPAWQQTAGDCKVVNCSGGNASRANQDTDVPADDGNNCTTDTCSNGNPVHPSKPGGTACSPPVNYVCNGVSPNPSCVQCYNNAQCTLPQTCNTSTWSCTCTPTTCGALGRTCGTVADNGCGSPLNCNNGQKDGTETGVDCGGNTATCATRCANGDTCSTGSDCGSSFCPAQDRVCCNVACTHICQACLADKTGYMTPDGTCGPVEADTNPDGDCTGGKACNGIMPGLCTLPL